MITQMQAINNYRWMLMDSRLDDVKRALQDMVGPDHAKKVEDVKEPYRGNLIYYLIRDSRQWSRRGLQLLIEMAFKYFGRRDSGK